MSKKTKSTVVALAAAAAVTRTVFVGPALDRLDIRRRARRSHKEGSRWLTATKPPTWSPLGGRTASTASAWTGAGYDVPWQETIALAPELQDDPVLVKLYKQTHITESDEEAVCSTQGFLDPARGCRILGPEQRGISDYGKVKDWPGILAKARQHGWSPDNPSRCSKVPFPPSPPFGLTPAEDACSCRKALG